MVSSSNPNIFPLLVFEQT